MPAPARRPRWGLRIAAGAATGVLVTAGAGHAVVAAVDRNIARVEAFSDLADRPEPGKGRNILLIGSDARQGLSRAERQTLHVGGAACNCADTIMIVHFSEDRDRVSVVSLPRDSHARLPDGTEGKINGALAMGGPSGMVSTVEAATGLRIDHYVEVGFASFVRAVDEVGGVEVCTVRRMRDKKAGLDLPPGTSTLSGAEALPYVRARHVDGSADFGRMQRQQRFLAAFIDKAASTEMLLHPSRLRRAADAVLDSVRVDPGFGARELVQLAEAMRGLGPGEAEFTSVPIGTLGNSTLTWEQPAADRLFRALHEDRALAPYVPEKDSRTQSVPVDVSPAAVRVQVADATSRPDAADRAVRDLADTGFAATRAPDRKGGTVQGHTTITHGPQQRAEAAALAAAVPGARLRESAEHSGALLLTVGEDFGGVQRVRDGRAPVRGEEFEGGGYAAATGDQIICD